MNPRGRLKRKTSNSESDSETLSARLIRLHDSDKPPNEPSPIRSRTTVPNPPCASAPSAVLSRRQLRSSACSPRADVEELRRQSIVRNRIACGERLERPPGEAMTPMCRKGHAWSREKHCPSIERPLHAGFRQPVRPSYNKP